jgi:hypothetical protein
MPLVAAYNGPAPGGGFLDWFPTTAANAGVNNPLPGNAAVTVQATLVSDFTAMVGGAGIYGCGIESQLESWYRFLVQPDPYCEPRGQRGWPGVLERGRHDDPARAGGLSATGFARRRDCPHRRERLGGRRSLAGRRGLPLHGSRLSARRWRLRSAQRIRPIRAARTQATAQNPNPPRYTALNDWGFDPNLRHVHMREKYGIDPQYPWQRYVLGLTSPMVPDRLGEYPSGRTTTSSAQRLHQSALCRVAAERPGAHGNRRLDDPLQSPGRDPHQGSHLLRHHRRRSEPALALRSERRPEKPALAGGLGTDSRRPAPRRVAIDTPSTDPANFNYNGIDPHMYESDKDRTTITGITFDTGAPMLSAAANSANGSDATNGREWTTDQPYNAMTGSYAPHVLPVDREYACIFPLATPRDCTHGAEQLPVRLPAHGDRHHGGPDAAAVQRRRIRRSRSLPRRIPRSASFRWPA